jgi:hypothetical protein
MSRGFDAFRGIILSLRGSILGETTFGDDEELMRYFGGVQWSKGKMFM